MMIIITINLTEASLNKGACLCFGYCFDAAITVISCQPFNISLIFIVFLLCIFF